MTDSTRVTIANIKTETGAAGEGKALVADGDGNVVLSGITQGTLDHGTLDGLLDDDHTQYFLLAGETTDAKLHSGADLIVYSDAGSTEKLRLDGATGNIEHQGNMTLDVKLAGSDSTLTITNTGAVGAVNVDVSGTITTEAIITDIGGSILVGQTNFHNGGDAVWYSDAGITEKARIDGATGNITTAGTVDGKDVAGHVDSTSIHFTRPISYVELEPFGFLAGIPCATGNGKAYLHIPAGLSGLALVECHAEVKTAGTTGTMSIMIANETQSVDMLSVALTIDTGETGSDTAATGYTIKSNGDEDITENDVIRIDFDAVHSTPAVGCIVTLGFN